MVDTSEITDHVREAVLTAKGQLLARGANGPSSVAAPTTDQFLMGAPVTDEGMAWKDGALAREAILKLYRENPNNPSSTPLANGANAIAMGDSAYARDAGHITRANGGFDGYAATAQRWEAILRNATTNATQTELFVDGASQQLVLPDHYAWNFEIRVVAREAGGDSAAYHFRGCIKRGTGAASTALVGTIDSPMADKEDASAWAVAVDADTTSGALRVRVTGEAEKVIRWVAAVDVVEVFNLTGGGSPNSATAVVIDQLFWDDFYTPDGGSWIEVKSTPYNNQPPWASYRVYYEHGASPSDPTISSPYIDMPNSGYSYILVSNPTHTHIYKVRAWKQGYELGPVATRSC